MSSIQPHGVRRSGPRILTKIDLGTLAGLLEHRQRLDAYCPRCDRWAVLDPAAMVAAGLGERGLPVRVRCQVCGEVGPLQLQPLMRTRETGQRNQA